MRCGSGRIVRLARLHAMFGGPTPTKQTRSPARSLAEATIIISVAVDARSSGVRSWKNRTLRGASTSSGRSSIAVRPPPPVVRAARSYRSGPGRRCPLPVDEGRTDIVSDMAGRKEEFLDLDGIEVKISNPDKVFFPRTGHTKLDLVRYYLAVAEGAIRGVDGRPMAMKRYVNGAEGEFFFQKRAPESRPPWIETVELAFPSGRTANEVVVRNAAQLAWVVNLGCIDLNPHPVRADDLDHPDELRVDLDPVPGVGWPEIIEVAMATKDALEDFGLTGWPKTSGSRGFHVYARVEPRWTFPEVRRAAMAYSSTTTRTPRTARWLRRTRSAPRRTRGSRPR